MRSKQDESELVLTASAENASEFARWCEAEGLTQAEGFSRLLALTRRALDAGERSDDDKFPDAFREARGKIAPGTLPD